MSWIKVIKIEDIPSMGSRVIRLPDIEIAIFKTRDESIFALENKCPHKEGKLNDGLIHEHIITCPLHNSDINLEDGIALEEGLGCAKKYETKIEKGVVYLEV